MDRPRTLPDRASRPLRSRHKNAANIGGGFYARQRGFYASLTEYACRAGDANMVKIDALRSPLSAYLDLTLAGVLPGFMILRECRETRNIRRGVGLNLLGKLILGNSGDSNGGFSLSHRYACIIRSLSFGKGAVTVPFCFASCWFNCLQQLPHPPHGPDLNPAGMTPRPVVGRAFNRRVLPMMAGSRA